MTEPLKACIAVADVDEISDVVDIVNDYKLFNIPVMHTGIGLVNSAVSVAQLKQQGYELIINVGTCGSASLEIGTVCEPIAFYQADMYIGPTTILDPCYVNDIDEYTALTSLKEEKICFSSNSFITKDSFIVAQGYKGIFDMEAYGFKKACNTFGIVYAPIKVVSDALSLTEHRYGISALKQNAVAIASLIESIYITGTHAVA